MPIEIVEIPIVAYPKENDTKASFDKHYHEMLCLQEQQLVRLNDLLNDGYRPLGEKTVYDLQRMKWERWTLHKQRIVWYEYDIAICSTIPCEENYVGSYMDAGWEQIGIRHQDGGMILFFRREKHVEQDGVNTWKPKQN